MMTAALTFYGSRAQTANFLRVQRNPDLFLRGSTNFIDQG